MDYKEKYKEALERAKNLHKDAIDMGETLRAKQCEIIFPELAETGDEKIKKRILLSLQKDLMATKNSGCDTKDLENCIAWLEKQGKKVIPKNIDDAALQYVDTCTVDGEVTHDNITEPYWNNHSMMNAYKAGWLEKQGENPQGKSALEAINEVKVDKSNSVTNAPYNYEHATITQKDFAPKQEWSEEDVAYIDELTDFFEHCGELHQPQEKVVKWLKSLKERLT